jgi:type I restriction enzyme R subunit
MKPIQLRTFDRRAEVAVFRRELPHWSQPGTVAFITWRTDDSIPADVLRQWRADRLAWLSQHGIDGLAGDWRLGFERLAEAEQNEFSRRFSDRWHDELDAGHGACVLRRPALAQIVADSLQHFDGERYDLTDFVVMPNHVHLLAAFPDEAGMLEQCESWKHFQATRINRILGRKGRFWQQDDFDHLVRTEAQFHYLRRYVAENGPRARLNPTEYRHYSKPLK